MNPSEDRKAEAKPLTPEWETKRDERMAKLWFGSMFYGYITLFVVAALADNSYECREPPCSPYPFIVAISLVIGFVISYTISFFSKKK